MKQTLAIVLTMLALVGCKTETTEVTPEPAPATPSAPTAMAEAPGATLAQQAPSTATAEAAAPSAPEVGQPAPAFTLRDHSGAEVSLASLRGKIVVLEWTNPQCPFVVRHYEANTMKQLAGEFGQQVEWLAIDSSHFITAEAASAWRTEEGLPYKVLLDADGAVGRRYHARTTPQMFVIDAEGTLRYSGAIDNDPRGNEETPVNYVKQAVEALVAGNEVATPTTTPYGCSVKYEAS